MALTLKKRKTTTRRAVLVEHAVLDENGVEVASLYQRMTTKTGFKRGLCVGQVPVKAWFFELSGQRKEHGGSEFGMGPKHRTRQSALEALEGVLASKVDA